MQTTQPRGGAVDHAGRTEGRRRVIQLAVLAATVVVLGWSILELGTLVARHTIGPELYGVLAAALATGAALSNVALLRLRRAETLLVVLVLALWAVVALSGVAGTLAHLVGLPPGEGQVDPRPRPVGAPLVFTLLGIIGGAALLVGHWPAVQRLSSLWKE